MAIMASSTWYLPDEELTPRNFPEVAIAEADILEIFDYGMRVSSAIDDYIDGTFDRIDIDIHDLIKYVNLCRSVCDSLGGAPNVCHDLLVEMRSIQNVLQQLVYAKNRYGDQFIGTPTEQ